jgi:serine/threonine protein kinase
MTMLKDRTLEDVFDEARRAEKPLSLAEALRLIRDIGEEARRSPVFHGKAHTGLRPAIVRLTDEGVELLPNPHEDDHSLLPHHDREYMAPEVAGAQPRGPASDVFSLAVFFYEAVTLENPFRGVNAFETFKRLEIHEFRPPSELRPDIGEDLEEVLLRALARYPRYRHLDVRTFVSELARAVAENDADSDADDDEDLWEGV